MARTQQQAPKQKPPLPKTVCLRNDPAAGHDGGSAGRQGSSLRGDLLLSSSWGVGLSRSKSFWGGRLTVVRA